MEKTALFFLVLGCALSTNLLSASAEPVAKDEPSASVAPDDKESSRGMHLVVSASGKTPETTGGVSKPRNVETAPAPAQSFNLPLADATTADTVVPPAGVTNDSCREDCHDEWRTCLLFCGMADDPMESKICYMDCRNDLNACYHGC